MGCCIPKKVRGRASRAVATGSAISFTFNPAKKKKTHLPSLHRKKCGFESRFPKLEEVPEVFPDF